MYCIWLPGSTENAKPGSLEVVTIIEFVNRVVHMWLTILWEPHLRDYAMDLCKIK